jgi:chemotaxis protein histidine kinase CheA
MSRSRDLFLAEAAQCLAELDATPGTDAEEGRRLHAAARRLRGSAQMARYSAVAQVAVRLERRSKRLADTGVPWSDTEAEAFRRDVEAANAAIRAVRAGTIPQDARITMAADRQGGGDATEIAIEELEYAPAAALKRALELRSPLEDGIVAEDAVGPILDEIFDLIRLGMR